jgi:type II secretory pathway pseudopilin PulG
MMIEKKPIVKSSSSGFTLVEIAIVTVLSSLLLAGSLNFIKSWMNKSGQTASQQRLVTIQQALTNFQTQYNRLPCPASFVGMSGAGFGREACGGGAVLVGTLPVHDLGLSDSYAANTGGYMYTYAATKVETVKLDGFQGAINIVDGSLVNSVLPTVSGKAIGATYVVVDHGTDGKGAPSLSSGVIGKACASAPGLDTHNCDHYGSGYFVSAPFSTKPGALTWFDDTIVYDTGPPTGTIPQVCQTVSSIPAGPGSSAGWNEWGTDSGSGGFEIPFAGGPFVFWYSDTFHLAASIPSYTTTSPTADAYCTYTTQYVLAGGCTNQNKAGAVYGLDITKNTDEQVVLPPLSHPALPDTTGRQGWECNGSSASGIYTQAYAICCSGG